ncbi:hypothetical protein PM082_001819 [Marasmius tenuissimus]|nr:hypothetical protein PM082_001819 [Marasmius tenuissimus]
MATNPNYRHLNNNLYTKHSKSKHTDPSKSEQWYHIHSKQSHAASPTEIYTGTGPGVNLISWNRHPLYVCSFTGLSVEETCDGQGEERSDKKTSSPVLILCSLTRLDRCPISGDGSKLGSADWRRGLDRDKIETSGGYWRRLGESTLGLYGCQKVGGRVARREGGIATTPVVELGIHRTFAEF